MSDEIAPHRHFQYASADHQSDTAIAGMWLFLATEVLFFGGLVLLDVLPPLAAGRLRCGRS